MRVLHGRRIAVLTLTVAFFTLAGVAVGSVPGSGGEINGCYATKGGALRVIDAAKESCAKGEVPIAWNQTGPSGPPGPPGTSGALPNLDALEGVPCSGVGGKPAHVHLTYGTGIEATVTIVCLTHLLANPGPFTVTATAGSLKLGVLPTLDLPTGWSLSGMVDTQGRLANVGLDHPVRHPVERERRPDRERHPQPDTRRDRRDDRPRVGRCGGRGHGIWGHHHPRERADPRDLRRDLPGRLCWFADLGAVLDHRPRSGIRPDDRETRPRRPLN